jgi:hypothetical protein
MHNVSRWNIWLINQFYNNIIVLQQCHLIPCQQYNFMFIIGIGWIGRICNGMVFALWLECLVSYLKTKIIPSLSPNQCMVV